MIMAPTRLQERWLLQTADAGIRIVLADGDDPRAREASRRLAEIGIAPILVTSEKGATAEAVECLDPREPGEAVAAVVAEAVDRQASKRGLSDAECAALAIDPLMVGVAAVRAGRAHGCVAGATRASADVARAAIRVVGMAPGRRTLSSSFIMALLSFSTKGSADHSSLEVIREAVERVRVMRPDLAVDGELQFDAAVVPHIAQAKAPGSPAAGRSNVFVFPNLAAGEYRLQDHRAARRRRRLRSPVPGTRRTDQ